MRSKSSLLIQEPPLQVLPSLVKVTSLNEAIFLQQLHYWINANGHEKDGQRWIYNTYSDWGKQMPWWNQRTIVRIIDSLRDRGLIETTSKYNKLAMDRTLWYSINYDAVEQLTSIVTECHDACESTTAIVTECHDHHDKLSQCYHDNLSSPITREYQETTTERGDHVTLPVNHPSPPPSSQTGDPYMDIAWAKSKGGKRFLSQRQTALMAIQSELPDLRLTPEQFTALVDCHLIEKGTKVLADSEGELADRELGGAQSFVIALCKVGRRFREVGGPKLVWDSWRKHDKRPNPSDHQLLQHASQMVAGKFEEKTAEKQTISYKDWMIRNYACDSPVVIGIPEAQLRAAYEQAIRMH